MTDFATALASAIRDTPPAEPQAEPGPRTWITNDQCDGWSDYDIEMTYDPDEDMYSAILVNDTGRRDAVRVTGYGRTEADAQSKMWMKVREDRA
jgi:hypothetical protein